MKELKTLKALYLQKMDLPIHLILHNTYICNAKCGHCFNWKNLNKHKAEDELTLEQFGKIAKSFDGKLLFLNLSGGEPFLRSDISDMCHLFTLHNKDLVSISIPTNGILPLKIKKEVEKICEKCKKTSISINLSLDGFEEFHDANRGVAGAFRKVFETYEALADLKKRYRNLSIKVTTVIMDKNSKDILKLAEYVLDKMPEVDFHNNILIRGSPKDNSLLLPPISELRELKIGLEKIWDRYSYRKDMNPAVRKLTNALGRYMYDLYVDISEQKKQVVPCDAWKNNAVIDALGNVQICELRYVIGNLKDYDFDFRKLWNSEKAEKLKESIKRKECFCTHGCVYPLNVMKRPLLFPKVSRYLL
jgi:MoaA/NifB/PqqE/SkfB family radical SAM enzyme